MLFVAKLGDALINRLASQYHKNKGFLLTLKIYASFNLTFKKSSVGFGESKNLRGSCSVSRRISRIVFCKSKNLCGTCFIRRRISTKGNSNSIRCSSINNCLCAGSSFRCFISHNFNCGRRLSCCCRNHSCNCSSCGNCCFNSTCNCTIRVSSYATGHNLSNRIRCGLNDRSRSLIWIDSSSSR